jgi:hypothetical protein
MAPKTSHPDSVMAGQKIPAATTPPTGRPDNPRPGEIAPPTSPRTDTPASKDPPKTVATLGGTSSLPFVSMPHGMGVSVTMGFELDCDQHGAHPPYTDDFTSDDWQEESAKDNLVMSKSDLVNVRQGGLRYVIGACVHALDPNGFVQGIRIKFYKPASWKWDDGSIPNPVDIELVWQDMWVKRVALAPKKFKQGKKFPFKVEILKTYCINMDAARSYAIEETKKDKDIGA